MNAVRSIVGRYLPTIAFDLSPNLGFEEPVWKRMAAATALFGLYAMAVGMGGFKALQNVGSALLILGSLPFLPEMVRRLRDHLASLIVLVFLAFLLLHTVAAVWVPDPPDVEHWYQARRISRILLVPAVAWWIGGHQKRIHRLLLCMLAGLVAGIVEVWIAWGTLEPMFDGSRVKFQLNQIRMAAMTGVAAIGLTLLARPFIAAVQVRAGRWLATSLWFMLVALMIQAFIVSQSRGAYIAFVIFGIGWAITAIWRGCRRGWGQLSWSRLAVPAVVATLILFAITLQWDAVTRKFESESDVIVQAASGDWNNPELNSFGMRIYLYKWGVEGFLQRPWFGWGADGSMEVINHTGKRDLPLSFNHFHNNYIDMLVRFGIVGSMIFLAMLAAFFCAAARSVADGLLDPRLLRLFLVTLAVFALGSLSFSFLESSHGWFLLILLGGMLCSADVWRDRSDVRKREPIRQTSADQPQ